MIKLMKNLLIVVVVIVLAFSLAQFFGSNYFSITGEPRSGLIPTKGGDYLIGLPLAYMLFLFLFFTAFGDQKKYWWMGILLIPAVLFELYFDWQHIYIPIILGLVGWVIGYGIYKLMNKPKAA
ncbi:MAG: hypothetical protein A3B10_01670 [Candidatus Doudnabacteria bacterium RIFCSPLOWO2_01_FULL_44_21]|uniref:Uncharacterized protein n=1 Tax=Candidatus Doudnabacteria bacterium RIFCSPLOWO2_01_FULL_44_21 TaxID=1817841 RepID=A0A1F5Q2I9_9BACT|nr:MAG: hypothetical protein A3B95_01550 [Candidatus Doudnabacteria bacterium RIFCSPHIGHO2_02_FULL_43_13b]OGE96376.1 MAG: hypothetical protein A3B10_01670 [Candidatus Doudnabacteria bacterium RIFCSPLOWO2_01_FULL_44_21]